jgi:hypothetical protein
MKLIQTIVTKIQEREEDLKNEIASAYTNGMNLIKSQAEKMVGQKVSIEEPISPRRRGRLVYKIVKINRVTRDFYSDPNGPVVLEYSAELVRKPKNYRGYHARKIGHVYNKRITLSENGFKVMKVVK